MKVLALVCVFLWPNVLSTSPDVCYLNEYTGLFYNPAYSKYPMTEAKITRRIRSHQPEKTDQAEKDLQSQQTSQPLMIKENEESEVCNHAKRSARYIKSNYDEPYYCPICRARIRQQEELTNLNGKAYNKFQRPRIDRTKLSPEDQFFYDLDHNCDQPSNEQLRLDSLNNPQVLYEMEMKLLEGKLPNWEALSRLDQPSKKLPLRKLSRNEKKPKLKSIIPNQSGLNYSMDDEDDMYSNVYQRYPRQLDSNGDSPPIITKKMKTEETAVFSKAGSETKQPQQTIVVVKNVEEVETNSPKGLVVDKVASNQDSNLQTLDTKDEN